MQSTLANEMCVNVILSKSVYLRTYLNSISDVDCVGKALDLGF